MEVPHEEYNNENDIPFKPDGRRSIAPGVEKVVGDSGRFTNLKLVRKVIILEDPDAFEEGKQKFFNEVKALRYARHGHVVEVFMSYLFHDETAKSLDCAIIMDRAEGNLEPYLVGGKPSTQLKRLSGWFGCLAAAVRYIHGRGIRHRDIKPPNILIKKDQVLLADFGISKMGLGRTAPTTFYPQPRSRTRQYCAPEVESGSTRGRSADIFSLGAVFLEMTVARYFSTTVSHLAETLTHSDNGNKIQSYAKKIDDVHEMLQALVDHAAAKMGVDNQQDRGQLDLLLLCQDMLSKDRENRPLAEQIVDRFVSWREDSASPVALCSCSNLVSLTDEDRLIDASGRTDGLGELRSLISKGVHKHTVGAIHHAAIRGIDAAVHTLLENGVDANQRGHFGETALHCAAGYGHRDLVGKLLDNLADTEAVNEDGQTALHCAAGYGHERVIEMLLDKGANPMARDIELATPLHYAARRGHKGVVLTLLRDIRTDVAADDKKGRIPLYYAAGYGSAHVVDALLEHLASSGSISEDCVKSALGYAKAASNPEGNYSQVETTLSKYLLEKVGDEEPNGSTSVVSSPRSDKLAASQSDLLTFLAAAQSLDIDILPITWHPALGRVAVGGTAEVRQAFLTPAAAFAFKRLRPSAGDPHTTNLPFLFRIMTSEIQVLGHPAVRNHPHINALYGICWDIEPRRGTICPVLVFEKSQYGHLGSFTKRGQGHKMALVDRLKLCADVAVAIRDMHAHDIVHGDIKPRNILVFKDSTGAYIAKVIDFGYSSRFAHTGERARMPTSIPWTAPEQNNYAMPVSTAKKMDAYSFGMLCLWLLYFSSEQDSGDYANSQHSFFRALQRQGPALTLATRLIEEETRLEGDASNSLAELFRLTLDHNPLRRISDFSKFLDLLDCWRRPGLSLNAASQHAQRSYRNDFRVDLSMHQLCRGPYEVRSHITACLEEKSRSSQSAAFDAAFCYKIGFGVEKDDDKTTDFLRLSEKTPEDMASRLNEVKNSGCRRRFQDTAFRDHLAKGYVQAVQPADHYRETNLLPLAEPKYRKEIADMESELGSENCFVLTLKSQRAQILGELGRWAEAEALAEEVLKFRKVHVRCTAIVQSMRDLARIYLKRGLWSKSKDLNEEIIDVVESLYGKGHAQSHSETSHLAAIYFAQSQWQDAERLLQPLAETNKKVLGIESPITATTISNLASTLVHQGRLGEAERMLKQVVDASKTILGNDHPNTIMAKNNLGSVYWYASRWEDAKSEFKAVAEANTKTLGAQHPSTLLSTANLAATYRSQGLLGPAEQIERVVFAERLKLWGEDHPDTLAALTNLATTLSCKGDLKEAEKLQLQSFEASSKILGECHSVTLDGAANLALVYWRRGRLDLAHQLCARVVDGQKRVMGEKSVGTITNVTRLALVAMEGQDLAKAEEFLVSIVEVCLETLGQQHPKTLSVMSEIGTLYSRQGKKDEAEVQLHNVLAMRRCFLDPGHPDILYSRMSHAKALFELDKLEEAEREFSETMNDCVEILGENHPKTLNCRVGLGVVAFARGRLNRAEKLFEEAIEGKSKVIGEMHPSTLDCMKSLVEVYMRTERLLEAKRLREKIEESGNCSSLRRRGEWWRIRWLLVITVFVALFLYIYGLGVKK